MSTLQVNTLKTYNSAPPVIQDSSGTEVGTFCRAWVNFNGTGTVAIRASFNVSSITDNGTGNYTVNFTTAMPDANYAHASMSASTSVETQPRQTVYKGGSKTVSSINIITELDDGTNLDSETVCLTIFR